MLRIVVTSGLVLLAALAGPAASAASAAPASPAATPAPSHPLNGVSCTSPRNCMAVGENSSANHGRGGPLAERWTGRKWVLSAVRQPRGITYGVLNGVSCTSATHCAAVGYDSTGALAEFWNGKAWSPAVPPSPPGGTGADLTGVSCVSLRFCMAVGSYSLRNGDIAVFAESWTGRKWTVAKPPEPAGSGYANLDSVSCTSPRNCVAVGFDSVRSSSPFALIERWNGKRWSAAKAPAGAQGAQGAFLNGVSCATATACSAVGGYSLATARTIALAESWNGRAWKPATAPASGDYPDLLSVSCASARSCVGVGEHGAIGYVRGTLDADSWNGKTWRVMKAPVPAGGYGGEVNGSELAAVKCLSAASCVAVGYVIKGNAEHGISEVWNGKAWKLVPTA